MLHTALPPETRDLSVGALTGEHWCALESSIRLLIYILHEHEALDRQLTSRLPRCHFNQCKRFRTMGLDFVFCWCRTSQCSGQKPLSAERHTEDHPQQETLPSSDRPLDVSEGTEAAMRGHGHAVCLFPNLYIIEAVIAIGIASRCF